MRVCPFIDGLKARAFVNKGLELIGLRSRWSDADSVVNCVAALKTNKSRLSPFEGTAPFRRTITSWYQRHDLDRIAKLYY